MTPEQAATWEEIKETFAGAFAKDVYHSGEPWDDDEVAE